MTGYGKLTAAKRKALSMYADPTIDVSTICAKLRISRQRLSQIRKEFGVPTRPRGPAPKTVVRLRTISRKMPALKRQIEDQGIAVSKLAADLKMPDDLLREALHDSGVAVRRKAVPDKVVDRWVALYLRRHLSSAEVARLVGRRQSTVYNKLRDRGVLRSVQETMLKYHERARRGAVVRNTPAR